MRNAKIYGLTLTTSGAAGDFRFQGAWLEDGSGLYNLRAREYDARLGRFTSRDPEETYFQTPETLHPYAFANNNAYVYRDPNGRETLIELDITTTIQAGLNALRYEAGQKVKQYLLKKITTAVRDQLINQLRRLLPLDDALNVLATDPFNAGNVFQKEMESIFCRCLGNMGQYLFFEPRVRRNGDAYSDGVNCVNRDAKRPGGNIPRPDVIVSLNPPTQGSGGIFIGEFKTSEEAYRNAYVFGRQAGQWIAIRNFAAKHCFTRTAVLFSFSKLERKTEVQLEKDAFKSGCVVFFISVK